MKTNLCPCNSNKDRDHCCLVFINNQAIPKTPEQLMRSRYTAYTQLNVDYIAATMKPPAANDFDKISTRSWARQVKWLKLEVIKSSAEGDKGYVEFIAYLKENGKACELHELSEFHFIDGRWYYVDGKRP